MKNFALNFLLSCICLIVASCSNEATIGGTAKNSKEISLYHFNKGVTTLLGSCPVDKESGSFEVKALLPSDGVYLVGVNDKALYPLYLKGGDNLKLKYEDNLLSVVEGRPSDENSLLFQWENEVNDVKTSSFFHYFLPGAHSVGEDKFFAALEKASHAKNDMLKQLVGKKGDFYKWLTAKVNADIDFYALNYLRNSGLDIAHAASVAPYYKSINGANFQDPVLLDIPYAGNMLETYVWYMSGAQYTSKWDVKYPVGLLKDKDLQQEYLLSEASKMKFYDEYINMMGQVGEDFFTETYAQRLKNIEEKLLWSKPGLPAPDFKAMAPDSSFMNLADYRGKVVVVDVWATWCEPCRRMMPLFHELQKEFKGKNVEFLSVCIGVWIESEKWLQLSKEFHIEKNNFFVTGWQSDFAKDYRISGVPRYMIFDGQGNIVSVNAPNPASPKLKELILKVLDEN